jgi:glycosyltransferase involved in cell wall biosynthesis
MSPRSLPRVAEPSRRALLINLGSPELDRLAAELTARGSLLAMVRRYLNKGRRWERRLAAAPFVGSLYAATLGRRVPPAGVDADLVIAAGEVPDFAAACVNRVGRISPKFSAALGRRLLGRTENAIATAACRLVARANVVVGSYHVAGPAFEEAKARGVRTILNYPIAHHRWQYRFFAEEAKRNREFAAALPTFGDVVKHARTLDREIELADSILVGSSFVRDSFLANGVPAERIAVIPYGVDTDRFAPAPDDAACSRPFRVVFVGQIGERKGISYLLHAYEAFRKPDTELQLVGSLVKGGQVYRRFAGLFRHTAHVPQAHLPALLRAADVLVLPTLVEGMPLVVLEAMACGVPVIVTPHGPADVVRNGIDGFVVPTCDSRAIVERLEELYANPERRKEMGRNARERAEHWSWRRYASAAADSVLASA